MRQFDRRELLLVLGFTVALAIAAGLTSTTFAYAGLKVRGRVDDRCTLALTRASWSRETWRNDTIAASKPPLSTAIPDRDLFRWDTPAGQVWTPKADDAGAHVAGIYFHGPPIQRWTPIQATGEDVIHKGDIVIDAGAHLGESALYALTLGASLVVAVEPAPENVRALRLNLAKQIAAGQVVVIDKGVYDREGSLTFVRSGLSWSGEFHTPDDGHEAHGEALAVTTIDAIVNLLRLPRVDVVKMDIEGSEPYALRGAHETLVTHKPRIVVGTYHHAGDLEAIERIVRETRPDYQAYPSRCLISRGRLIPNLLYFH
jgi:FkbM family methyltransferase